MIMIMIMIMIIIIIIIIISLTSDGSERITEALNTERSYKRQGHATSKHFVGFFVQ